MTGTTPERTAPERTAPERTASDRTASDRTASTAPAPGPTGSGADRPDPVSMPYEAARDELVETVRRLESGNTDLEESLSLWERGEALAARCQEVLDGAMQRLEGATSAQPGGDATGGGAGG